MDWSDFVRCLRIFNNEQLGSLAVSITVQNTVVNPRSAGLPIA